MESFFSLLQKDALNPRRWATAETCGGDHHLDRDHLQPPPTPTRPRSAHTHQVRDTPPCRLTAPTRPSQQDSGQTRRGACHLRRGV